MIVQPSPGELATSAAESIAELSDVAVHEAGVFTIALTGGSTPRQLYETLASEPFLSRIVWDRWRVYFTDERAVKPDHPQSNYRLVDDNLLSVVPIPRDRVYRMQGESSDLDAAAAEYSRLLAETLPHGATGAPRMRCVLLGLGENGHIASLFPSTPALDVTDRWAVRGLADYAPFDRITLTLPTINAADNVVFLVTVATKTAALRATAQGIVPASRVLPVDGSLFWYLDGEAAHGLV